MSIGYACLAVGVRHTAMKSCLLKNATEDRLYQLIGENIKALETLIDYNIAHGIKLFRISSDLIPFGSNPVNMLSWWQLYHNEFQRIGKKMRESGMRVSMHPGQYTVLNSPDEGVVARAILDLEYHARVLDSLQMSEEHKIILHIGGVYSDKNQAGKRFVENFGRLPGNVKKRIVIENDDKSYAVDDVLDIGTKLKIPVVFDILHHEVKPPVTEKSVQEWLFACALTWQKKDGKQKIHYSEQHREKKKGSHADTIGIESFMRFYHNLEDKDIDIMLEVKDKNLSAVKCLNCITTERSIKKLEAEWQKYKYTVLEKSPVIYRETRELLKDKKAYPAFSFYCLLEKALAMPEDKGHAVNALEHVWGYFKKSAIAKEKERFQLMVSRYMRGEMKLATIKNYLLKLAEKYGSEYLLQSYYFIL